MAYALGRNAADQTAAAGNVRRIYNFLFYNRYVEIGASMSMLKRAIEDKVTDANASEWYSTLTLDEQQKLNQEISEITAKMVKAFNDFGEAMAQLYSEMIPKFAELGKAIAEAIAAAEEEHSETIVCPDCDGSGELAGDYFADDGMATCDRCGGKGEIKPSED